MKRDTLGAKAILKNSDLTTKLRMKIPKFSVTIKKPAGRDVGSPYLSRTKPPSVVAGESNLKTPAPVSTAAGICCLVQEKVPPVNRLSERNSKLNKTARATSFFLTRDIKERT